MGQVELYVAVMAGVVLSLFLSVGELVALRKTAFRLVERWSRLFRSGRMLRVAAESCGVAVLFLLQAAVIAVLVAAALGDLNPRFTRNVSRQIRQELMLLPRFSGQGDRGPDETGGYRGAEAARASTNA